MHSASQYNCDCWVFLYGYKYKKVRILRITYQFLVTTNGLRQPACKKSNCQQNNISAMFSLRNGLQLSFRVHRCSLCLRPILKILPSLNSFKKTKRTYCSKEDDSENEIIGDVPTDRTEKDPIRTEKYLKNEIQGETTSEQSEEFGKFNLFSRQKPVLKSDFPSDVEEYEKELKEYKMYQAQHSFRPRKDPTTTSIILFPGQGSQYVGMGEKLLFYPGVPKLFEMASDILGYDLLTLCLNGPKKELDKTVHCQPAIFVTSLAAIQKMKEENPEVNQLSGLSSV